MFPLRQAMDSYEWRAAHGGARLAKTIGRGRAAVNQSKGVQRASRGQLGVRQCMVLFACADQRRDQVVGGLRFVARDKLAEIFYQSVHAVGDAAIAAGARSASIDLGVKA